MPVLERRRRQVRDRRFRRARHDAKAAPTSSRRPNASPSSTTTARCGASTRCRCRCSSPWPRSKRLAEQDPSLLEKPAFKAMIEGDLQDAGVAAEEGRVRAGVRHARRHDRRRVPRQRRALAATGAAPEAATHLFKQGAYLPQCELLDLPARQRLQDLHRHRRRRRVRPRRWPRSSTASRPSRWSARARSMKVETGDGQPVLRKLPELGSFDDREEKVVNIALHIGRRPIFAFGNSDGDLAMMRYTLAGSGPRMAWYLHHDDAAARIRLRPRLQAQHACAKALDHADEYGIGRGQHEERLEPGVRRNERPSYRRRRLRSAAARQHADDEHGPHPRRRLHDGLRPSLSRGSAGAQGARSTASGSTGIAVTNARVRALRRRQPATSRWPRRPADPADYPGADPEMLAPSSVVFLPAAAAAWTCAITTTGGTTCPAPTGAIRAGRQLDRGPGRPSGRARRLRGRGGLRAMGRQGAADRSRVGVRRARRTGRRRVRLGR